MREEIKSTELQPRSPPARVPCTPRGRPSFQLSLNVSTEYSGGFSHLIRTQLHFKSGTIISISVNLFIIHPPMLNRLSTNHPFSNLPSHSHYLSLTKVRPLTLALYCPSCFQCSKQIMRIPILQWPCPVNVLCIKSKSHKDSLSPSSHAHLESPMML